MSMYKIFVDGLEMPWGTPRMTAKIKNRDKEIELINGQTMTRIKSPGLSTFEFDVYLPNPDPYLEKFSSLKLGQKPFQLIVIRDGAERPEELADTAIWKKPTNVTVTLVDYTRDEDSKNGTVSKVALTFKEYVNFQTGSVTVEVPEYVPVNPNAPPSEDNTVNVYQQEISRIEKLDPPEEYKVKAQMQYTTIPFPLFTYTIESWKTISKKLLGDEKYAKALSELNKAKRNDSAWYTGWNTFKFPGNLYPKPHATIKIDVKTIVELYHKMEAE